MNSPDLTFRLFQTYRWREIKDLGRLRFHRWTDPWHPTFVGRPCWIFGVHVPCANGDGGIFYEFQRHAKYGPKRRQRGRWWECVGLGRARYGHEAFRLMFPEVFAAMPVEKT
jgi:hypothetical protein